MHTDLSDSQIESVLRERKYAHMSCMLPDARMYVVPITFVYKDGVIYSFSYPGQKIDALRANPSVCLQTERAVQDGTWESVIVWGTYEELKHEERLKGIKTIYARLEQEDDMTLSPLFRAPQEKDDEFIFYRIRIDEMTGKRIKNDY